MLRIGTRVLVIDKQMMLSLNDVVRILRVFYKQQSNTHTGTYHIRVYRIFKNNVIKQIFEIRI